MLIVAAEQLQAEQVVAGHEPLNFIENGEGIKGRQLGFEIVGGEPDGVTIRLARLCAAGLAHVGT